MTTSNMHVGNTWIQVAADIDTPVLITWDDPVELEIAATATNTQPTITGHKVNREEAITRYAIGDGFLWMRTPKGYAGGNVLVVVSK